METETLVPQFVSEKPSNRDAFFRAAAGLAGLLLLTFLVLLLYQEQSGLKMYRKSGVFQSEFGVVASPTGDSLRVFRVVHERDFPDGLQPVIGDTILKIGSENATPDYWRTAMQRAMPPDTQIVLQVSGEQGVHNYVMHARLETAANFTMLLLIDILRFLIALGFIGVGLWAFFAQPNSVPVRVFAWFCFSMTAVMISGVRIMPTYMGTVQIPYMDQVRNSLGIFALGLSVFWLHLQLLFPRPLKFVAKHRNWLIPAIYVPWVTLIVVALMEAITGFDTNLAEKISQWVLLPMLLSLVIGFVILSRRFARTEDRLEKRQLRLVF